MGIGVMLCVSLLLDSIDDNNLQPQRIKTYRLTQGSPAVISEELLCFEQISFLGSFLSFPQQLFWAACIFKCSPQRTSAACLLHQRISIF